MLRSAKQLKDFSLGAKDGRIGHAVEVYFEDLSWTIRYMAVKAGNWLTGRMVLLSPHVMGKPEGNEKIIPVDLTREQVRNSPAPESHLPVSRQFEMDYYRYFGWPYYWVGPYLWGPSPFPVLPAAPPEGMGPASATGAAAAGTAVGSTESDPHLRSSDEVTGYHIQAQDGDIGHVEDFLFDDKDWSIRYLVVDTRNWWPGKKVLIPPQWISEILWEARTVETEVVKADILQAPAFDPGKPMTAEYENELKRYYETDMHKV